MKKPLIICFDQNESSSRPLQLLLHHNWGKEFAIKLFADLSQAIEFLGTVPDNQRELAVVIAVNDGTIQNIKDFLIKVFEISPETYSILSTAGATFEEITSIVNKAHLFRLFSYSSDQRELATGIQNAIKKFFDNRELKLQSIALEKINRQLHEANEGLKATKDHLLEINKISDYVMNSLNLQTVAINFIAKVVQTICPEGSGSILLYEEKRKSFVFYASYGLAPEYVKTFEIEASATKLYTYDIVTSRKGRILGKEEIAPFQNEATLQLHFGRKYVEQLVMPIVSQDETIGLVTISNYDEENPFNDIHLQSMDNICRSLSRHFENARLYTHLKALNEACEKYVPQEFLSILGKNSILDVKLGDQVQKKMTVLFSDIRSFTSLSETMTPQENFRFINSYLGKMGPLVRESNGFIDKFIGDSIMALFENSAADAILSAIKMLKMLEDYNAGRQRAGYVPIKIGIGINTGSLMLGTLGDSTRMESTVISDAVNLSSRLQGLTKIYKAPLLISEFTYQDLPDPSLFSSRFIDRLNVKGKVEPVTILEILDAETQSEQQKKLATSEIYTEGWKFYQQKDYRSALKLFKKCLKQNPGDNAPRLYVEKCRHYLQR